MKSGTNIVNPEKNQRTFHQLRGKFTRNGKMKRKFRNFEDAREFVQTLGLKGQKDWVEYCTSGNRPSDIPANLDKTYKNKGWTTMGDFLGTNTVATFNRKYKTFEDAREFVQTLGLKSGKEWQEYCKTGNKSGDIPSFVFVSFV